MDEEVQDASLGLRDGLDGGPATDAAGFEEGFTGFARAGELREGRCGEGCAFHGLERKVAVEAPGGLDFPGARVEA